MIKICKKCKNEIDIKNGNICNKCITEKRKKYMEKYHKDNYISNPKILVKNFDSKQYFKQYNIDNKEKLKIYQKEYRSNRRKNDPLFKLVCNIRSLQNNIFKRNGYKKNSKTFDILGCTFEEFLIYITNQFEPWMTLENNGIYTGNYNETWQLDHIQPISNAKSPEDIIKLNHYTNFKPLCSRKNLEKSNLF